MPCIPVGQCLWVCGSCYVSNLILGQGHDIEVGHKEAQEKSIVSWGGRVDEANEIEEC